MSEASFREEVEHTIKLYEREIGHIATRTWPMIDKYGEVEDPFATHGKRRPSTGLQSIT